MSDRDDAFLTRLLATFRVEAGEHLEAISSRLLELQRGAEDDRAAVVEHIFREAHSLKGAARAVNLPEIESVCHSLETLFAGWKSGRLPIVPEVFETVQEAVDGIRRLLLSSGDERRSLSSSIVRKVDAAMRQRGSAPPVDVPRPEQRPAREPVVADAASTIRVDTEKLDSIMRQAEELLGARLTSAQRLVDLREIRAAIAGWKREHDSRGRLVKPSPSGATAAHAAVLERASDEAAFVRAIDERLARMERSAIADHRTFSAMVDALLHEVRETQMLPFSSLADGFRTVVRELAREQQKRVELLILGGDIQVDRRILEEMKAPFNHLLRNCIDHGIETPAVRERSGKPAQGTITITVAARDSRVDLAIGDDGRGLDAAELKAAAAKSGVASEAIDAMTDREALGLIFHSGFSTRPDVTHLSGRGLGLAIVREKVERLGGAITAESELGAGTAIRIELPLTLATFRGVLVRASAQPFIIPAASVERVARIPESEIRTVENRETISLQGETLSVVSLRDVLELSRAESLSSDFTHVVILRAAGDRVAFRVDAVIAEQEVLVRNLGPQLERVRNVSGASVLGTGEIVPVLNVLDLMQAAVSSPAPAPSVSVAFPAAPAPAAKRSILVVEDSITSRTLIKNILETAGYDVAVAVDGLDAWTSLKMRRFDLVVSDVEMPRMDGFDLTAKIRADERLAELPVVLVTALASREHRERGIDAGANAYIVKGSFDQSNLLEAIRRLI